MQFFLITKAAPAEALLQLSDKQSKPLQYSFFLIAGSYLCKGSL